MKELQHADVLKARGFYIDDTCYPWFAYKGLRGQPTEYHWCYTKLESELIRERDMRRRHARAALAAQDQNFREVYGDPRGRDKPETD